MNELHLIYVNPIGKTSDGLYEYDFFFSDDPDVTWAEDWAEQCPSICEDIQPNDSMVQDRRRVVTEVPLFPAQKNNCFSMQDAIDGVLSICFEDISEYEEYPEPYRLVFRFGEAIGEVEEKLNGRDIHWEVTPAKNADGKDQ